MRPPDTWYTLVQPLGCPITTSNDCWLTVISGSDSFMSCLDSLPGYSRGVPDFTTYILVLVVFGAVDLPLTSPMLVHFLETQFEMIVGLYVWHNEEHLFHYLGYISTYVFTYTLMIHNIIIPSYYLLHFHVQNSALFWKSNLVLSLYIDVVLTLSISMSFVFMLWMCQYDGFSNIYIT